MKQYKTISLLVIIAAMFVVACTKNNESNTAVEETGKVTQVTLIGDGEMLYTCPMSQDMVFSTTDKERCTVCNMKLRKMEEKDKEHLKTLKEKYKNKKIALSN